MGNDGKPQFTSNHAGGILGGISSGQDVVVRFAVKPTSSILTPRKTIDKQGRPVEIVTKGRHDPCVGIRAVPVGEAMVACTLLDHVLLHRGHVGENQGRSADARSVPVATFPQAQCRARSMSTRSAYFCPISKRFASCGPAARSPTQSDSTTVLKLWAIASITLALTHPLVVHPAITRLSIPRAVRTAASEVPKNAEASKLADDQIAVFRRQAFQDLAFAGVLCQSPQGWDLFAPQSRIRSVLRIDDPGKDHRQSAPAPLGKDRDRRVRRRLDIAATEHRRIDKAVDEIHDQQRRRPAQTGAVTKALFGVDIGIGHRLSPETRRETGSASLICRSSLVPRDWFPFRPPDHTRPDLAHVGKNQGRIG